MNSDYNQPTAAHYSAYRPPLHDIILKRVLANSSAFSNGLDIGCGTGYSAIALATYSRNVLGIDPSQSMLDRATDHPKIKYVKASGEKIPLPDHSVDIVTLAGSLFYMNLNVVGSEIKRVCRKGALVVSYDFKILLDDVLESLSVSQKENELEYDYRLNFSGQEGFEEILVKQEQINLELLGDQLAHVLLSEPHLYEKFCDKYSTEKPFKRLVESLVKSGNHFFVKTDLFYSKYQLV